VKSSSSHSGHLSVGTSVRIIPSYSKSNFVSMYSTQHLGHSKEPAFNVSDCDLRESFKCFTGGLWGLRVLRVFQIFLFSANQQITMVYEKRLLCVYLTFI
jgi:hypothetical protein